MTAETLIIGLGNVLMQDEGIGVRAVEELECRYHLPEGVEAIDGGTSGTELLEHMRGVKNLIVADAINSKSPPGTFIRLVDEQVPAFFQTKISNHQLGLSDLLAVLKVTGGAPETVTIVGMVPHVLENKLGLSPETEKAVGKMVDHLLEELERFGIEAKLRDEPLKGFWEGQALSGELRCV